ncbi:hypothetical protein FJT64_016289 [Amphibalanus amphitrite]|uniref:Glutamate receptor ionotropic, delta-1 n=1 Tax=Amphibalanus amphitrite TaxID=1232801 RepID=A0A6A4XDF1_AMPAM|nr:hypothetical protein FJT64_016289 [Amphibalanus amphitrite]
MDDTRANGSTRAALGATPLSWELSDVLPLTAQLSVLRQLREQDLLPAAADGLGLTLCGDFPPEPAPGPPLWDAPVLVRTCRRCQGPFRAELLRDQPMLPRALLQGAGCEYWPGARPLPHWSPRPAVLLGRLDCRAGLLRPELDRLPDALCLQLDGRLPDTAERTGRLFRRTFALRAVREIGSWSSSGGLRVTDYRTGVQPNGHIVTDGTPLRVAFIQYTSNQYNCRRPTPENGTCSAVGVHTQMPLFRFIQLELKLLEMAQQYNTTLEFVDTARLPPLRTSVRLPRSTLRAVGLLASGGADHTWPNSALQSAIYQLPVSMVDNRYLVPFSFVTVRRPARLDASQLLRLLSPGAWAALGVSTMLMAVLLVVMHHLGSHGVRFSDALAMLLGQSVSLGAERLLARHRPLVGVWVAMSLILTTAFLSDLITALTVPRDYPPRTARDLVQQNYRLLADFGHMKTVYSHSPNPHVRKLASKMEIVSSPDKIPQALLGRRTAYTMALPAVWETVVGVMRRSNGSALFEDINMGDEAFGVTLFGSMWSKHHPLVERRFAFANRRLASGLTSGRRFEEQARHFGLRARSDAVASMHGPLLLCAVGLLLGLLTLLLELAAARLASRRQRVRQDPVQVDPLAPLRSATAGRGPAGSDGMSVVVP